MVSSVSGPVTMFHANLCIAQMGTSDTMKNEEGDGVLNNVVPMVD